MFNVHVSPAQTNLNLGLCTSIPKQNSRVYSYRLTKEINMAVHEHRNGVQLVEIYKNKKILTYNSTESISKLADQPMDTL